MESLYARRTHKVQKSFIREILKVSKDPSMISFAGGLPNPKFFPVEPFKAAADKVLTDAGPEALQYSTTEGYLPLREWIAQRYWQRFQLRVSPDEILITNGSQQGLDLLGKLFLDKGDQVLIERPGYLGAIQALAFYEPQIDAVPVYEDGVDTALFEEALQQHQPKLFYTVPNFQNPSGYTYSDQKRAAVANLIADYPMLCIEDDPYGELRFEGESLPPLKSYNHEQVILLGTFSKIVSPGIRLGWVCAPRPIIEKLVVIKQAADLHSNNLAQRIVSQYLQDNDLDQHLLTIKQVYQAQRDHMLTMIKSTLPESVQVASPEGGMFLWLTLPPGISSLALFEAASQAQVVFVPGLPFYVDGGGHNTARFNFSNSDEARIETGIRRLGQAFARCLDQQPDVVTQVT